MRRKRRHALGALLLERVPKRCRKRDDARDRRRVPNVVDIKRHGLETHPFRSQHRQIHIHQPRKIFRPYHGINIKRRHDYFFMINAKRIDDIFFCFSSRKVNIGSFARHLPLDVFRVRRNDKSEKCCAEFFMSLLCDRARFFSCAFFKSEHDDHFLFRIVCRCKRAQRCADNLPAFFIHRKQDEMIVFLPPLLFSF